MPGFPLTTYDYIKNVQAHMNKMLAPPSEIGGQGEYIQFLRDQFQAGSASLSDAGTGPANELTGDGPAKKKTPWGKNVPIGDYLQAGAGAMNLYNMYQNMQQEAEAINTQAPTEQKDAYGRPTYNVGKFASETWGISPQGASAGEVGSGLLSGASAGAAFGPIGAIGGAIVGGLTSLFGGEDRAETQRRKRREAEASLRRAQQQYNTDMMAFQNNQLAAENYGNLMQNEQKRAQNLYSFKNTYSV